MIWRIQILQHRHSEFSLGEHLLAPVSEPHPEGVAGDALIQRQVARIEQRDDRLQRSLDLFEPARNKGGLPDGEVGGVAHRRAAFRAPFGADAVLVTQASIRPSASRAAIAIPALTSDAEETGTLLPATEITE